MEGESNSLISQPFKIASTTGPTYPPPNVSCGHQYNFIIIGLIIESVKLIICSYVRIL